MTCPRNAHTQQPRLDNTFTTLLTRLLDHIVAKTPFSNCDFVYRTCSSHVLCDAEAKRNHPPQPSFFRGFQTGSTRRKRWNKIWFLHPCRPCNTNNVRIATAALWYGSRATYVLILGQLRANLGLKTGVLRGRSARGHSACRYAYGCSGGHRCAGRHRLGHSTRSEHVYDSCLYVLA